VRTFMMYRKGDISATHDENTANPPDEPQFEGVIFADGVVVIRWCTAIKSISVFDSMLALLKVHGHPEYGSVLQWTDGYCHDARALGGFEIEWRGVGCSVESA